MTGLAEPRPTRPAADPPPLSAGPTGVHFFMVPDGISVQQAGQLDPDRDWRYFYSGKDAWIIQTWLRLRTLGRPVTLSERAPESGLIVFHKEDQRALLNALAPTARPVLLGVRADFRSADAADFEVLQNGYFADAQRFFFIPHWPQPGLLARDASRGNRVQHIAFKGDITNLDPALFSNGFQEFLSQNDMSFAANMTQPSDCTRPIKADWHDYHDVDVVLALRPPTPREYTHKPASKLCNAWIAGVPAVLGADYAYRELRRSPLDYLEINSAAEARVALLRLKREPNLYLDMVQNGLQRAADFRAPRIAERWSELLFQTVPARAAQRAPGYFARGPRRRRVLFRKARAWLRGNVRK